MQNVHVYARHLSQNRYVGKVEYLIEKWVNKNRCFPLELGNVCAKGGKADYISQTPVEIYGKNMIRLAFPVH